MTNEILKANIKEENYDFHNTKARLNFSFLTPAEMLVRREEWPEEMC
jgi:hypothetical protein